MKAALQRLPVREVEEWIGANADTPIPPRVKARVFERYSGRCFWSGVKIRAGDPWEAEHILAIINGGENREQNLAPCLKDKHREKTAEDVAIKSKTARMRAKNLGIWPKSKRPLKSRGFDRSRPTPTRTTP